MLPLLLFALAPFLGPARSGQEPDQGALAIVHANVIPMTSGASVLEDHTVIVRAGRIEVVGPSAELEVPEDCQVIQGQGRFLLPGLADMHVHVQGYDDLVLNVAAGVTTVRNLWGRPMHLEMYRRAQEEELFGPTVYTTGPITDGDPPLWDDSVSVGDAESAAVAVEQQKESGYESVKVYSALGEEAYHAILEAAFEHDMRVTGHVPNSVGIRNALAAGQDCIEHLEGYFPWGVGEPGEDAPELVALTLEAETWNCVTLVVMRNISMLGQVEVLEARPEMRFVDPRVRASWNPAFDWRFKNTTDEAFLGMQGRVRSMQSFTGQLHEAGAGILAGTDTPNPYVVPGFALHDELALLVESGLTPHEALLAATAQPAVYLERRGEFGRVLPGLRADLLLLEENPLEDIAATRKRAGVVLRGRWFSAEDLAARLEELAAKYEVDVATRLLETPLELGAQGDPWIGGLYEARINNVPTGAERLAIHAEATGHVLRSQGLDLADAAWLPELEVKLDSEFLLESFRYHVEGAERGFHTSGEWSEAGVNLAFGLGADRVAQELGLGSDAILSLPTAATLQLLALRCRDLEPEALRTFTELEIELEPLDIEANRIHVRALPIDSATGERGFEVRNSTDANVIELSIDAKGRLLEARVQRQIGQLDFVLVGD